MKKDIIFAVLVFVFYNSAIPNPQYPRRQRRLGRIFDQSPAYFLTICTEGRQWVLANYAVFMRLQSFCDDSMARYNVFVDCHVLMPDHVHLIITISPNSDTMVGAWVKAFKAVVANREFRWQPGFFDHVLRSDESRSEKWEYIRMNPVRAGLVKDPDDWPFAQRCNPFDGTEM